MPIMIQFNKGLSSPTIVCDYCEKPIVKAQDGGYFFNSTDRQEGQTVPLIFLHKPRCDERYSAKHGRLEGWNELEMFPGYLAESIGLRKKTWSKL